MITFVELGRLGRIGNQMFQYAALRGLALRNGYEAKIPDPKTRAWHGQKCLLDTLNLTSGILTESEARALKGRYVEPDYMSFDENFFNLPDNIDLYGFFQSTLYFKGFEEEISKELTPKQEFIEEASHLIGEIKTNYLEHEIVSIHLRRGDNVDGSNPSKELNEMFGTGDSLEDNSFYGKYLKAAKDKFAGKKVKFLVFSGGSRKSGNSNETDLEWCRTNLAGEEYVHAQPNHSMCDFSSIMLCDHNIISHISSFGWWAAYIGHARDREKRVIAPLNYHPDRPNMGHRKGFYPNIWELV